MRLHRLDRENRRGSVAVEMAILLPLLMFLAVIGVDYARVFSRTLILESASRNACWYACQDQDNADNVTMITLVAQRDLTDVSPTPTVTTSQYVGADGFKYVRVNVSMTFTTITNYPGVPSTSTLTRTTDMRICPTTPKPGTF